MLLAGERHRVVAYIRVSSRGQTYEAQKTAIERAAAAKGEPVDRWFADVASGASTERPGLRQLRAAVARGDAQTLWVWALDRLARSGIVDTLQLLRELRAEGCGVRSVVDPFDLQGPLAEPCIAMMAWCAEQERVRSKERQAAGIARMRLEGRRAGRPPLGDEQRAACRTLSAAGYSVRQIARELKVSKSSVCNFLHAAVAAE